jgi:predicted AlkP superfamily phosphohydrolase/phosphomutase
MKNILKSTFSGSVSRAEPLAGAFAAHMKTGATAGRLGLLAYHHRDDGAISAQFSGISR